MKKILIALSGIILIAFFVLLAASAQTKDPEGKKPGTEVLKNCGKCPSAEKCPMASKDQTASKECQAKCKEANCDHSKCKGTAGKECKGDAAACQQKCKEVAAAAPKCEGKCKMISAK